MNKHNGHIASCMCCAHFGIVLDSDLSDITPGDGWFYFCKKLVWDQESVGGDNLHATLASGSGCDKFIEKEWSEIVNILTGEKAYAKTIEGDLIEFKSPSRFVTSMPLFEKLWRWV